MPDYTNAGPSTLPVPLGVPFWRGEVERADRAAQQKHPQWDENVQWYTGQSPDAKAAVGQDADFVNVNVDFYQVEQKVWQLFYDTPDLQAEGTGILKGQSSIIQAHRLLMQALLSEDAIDIMTPIVRVLKDCLCVSGTGPLILGYEPFQKQAPPMPEQPGAILNLAPEPIAVTLYDRLYADHVSPKKHLIPAEFMDTDWDKAPWLGIKFRMPLTLAQTAFTLPPEFTGTTSKDEHVLDPSSKLDEGADQAYVDGTILWYRAAAFESGVHPELFRELVLIDGLETEARHRDSPHQVFLPDGRLSGDSLIGNPIHPLTIRTVPDSAYVPSDSQMTRPLVREKCKFRTQMVQERDANRPINLYDIDKITPEILAKIANRGIGGLVGVEGGALAQGADSLVKQVVPAGSGRQTYVAEDYITRDIEKTLAIDATGAGVASEDNESATKTAAVERNRNVRVDGERRQVLRWYLKLVNKLSALALRYLTPQSVVPYIGQEAAQQWGQLQQLVKQGVDGRLVFKARPDSQIRLDAAQERKFALDLYQFCAKDPNVVRVELLKNLFEKAGLDHTKVIVEQLPEKGPDGSFNFAMKAEDLGAPWGDQTREILAQLGVQVSPEAVDAGASQMFKQQALGLRDASGKAVTAQKKPAEHGGTAEKVRPLSQQSADLTGQRAGPKTETAA